MRVVEVMYLIDPMNGDGCKVSLDIMDQPPELSLGRRTIPRDPFFRIVVFGLTVLTEWVRVLLGITNRHDWIPAVLLAVVGVREIARFRRERHKPSS